MKRFLAREPLVSDLLDFARGRLAAVLALIAGGALLEGGGIVLLVPILGLALGGAESLAAEYAAPFFRLVGAETAGGRLLALLAVFAVLALLRAAVMLKRDIATTRLSQDFVRRLRSRAFRALAARSWGDLAGLQHTAVGHALIRDVDRVEDAVAVIIGGVSAAVVVVVQLGLALLLAPVLALFAILVGALGFLALRRLRARAAELGRGFSREDMAFYDSTQRFLSGLKPAKAHRLEGDYVAAFDRALRARQEQTVRWSVDRSLAQLILQTGLAFTAVVAILAGTFWIGLSAEVLIATVLILARVYPPVQQLQMLAQSVRYASSAYRVARDLAEEPAAAREALPAGPAPPPLDHAPEIAFEAVTVGSGGGDGARILDRVDCRIPAGRVTALIGPSGAGKSTLADLAVGLIRPDAGRVLIDGAPLEGAMLARLGVSLAYVGQEPFMLGRSLRDNLRWGNPEASEAELHEAIDLVGARPMVEALEGGLDGWVRQEGTRFSGGERQRLRIARAWLRRPRFLVLDEATNALDPEAEHTLLGRLFAGRRAATVLMITHRPTTAARADHVILLEHGRVAASGPPEVLSDLPGGAFGAAFAPALPG